jgi:hypothetical protein
MYFSIEREASRSLRCCLRRGHTLAPMSALFQILECVHSAERSARDCQGMHAAPADFDVERSSYLNVLRLGEQERKIRGQRE